MPTYDAFISYSHANDKAIAAALQSAIQKLGKAWYQRRALRVFRDDTSLSATPHLWPSIQEALNESRFLILLASGEAAASPWVDKEVAYWLEHKNIDTLFIAVTDGDLAWDAEGNRFREGGPLPPAARGRFITEPKWVDLRAYREGADKRDAKFTELAADFAAAIRGMPKEDLLSQEVRQQRRALTLAWSAATMLLLLAIAAAGTGFLAYRAQKEAVAQRDRAEQTLSAATQTASTLVTDLAVRFRGVSGISVTLVKDILDRARHLQDQLFSHGEMSLELRRSQSLALNETSTTLLTLGDADGALELARKAHSILVSLTTAQPENTEWQRALAASNDRIGKALSLLGHLDEAVTAYRDGIAIIRSLIHKEPTNSKWQNELPYLLMDLANALAIQGKSEEALATYREALKIRRQFAAIEPDDPARQIDVAIASARVGAVLQKQGKLADALDAFRERLSILRDLTAKTPDNTHWQFLLAWAYIDVAEALKLAGKLDDSLGTYQEAVEVAKALILADSSNTDYQSTLSKCYERMGNVLVWMRRYDEAQASYQKGLDINKGLAVKDPKNVVWQRDVAVSHASIGDVMLKQGKLKEALAEFRQTEAIADAIADRDPTNAEWQSIRSNTKYRIGDVLTGQGKYDEAIALYRQCVTILERLTSKDPNNGDKKRDLMQIYLKLGNALERWGKLEQALAAYRDAQVIAETLASRDQKNKDWQRNLAVTYLNVGDALSSLGRYEEAISVYRQSLSIRKVLLAEEPANSMFQRDLQGTIHRLVEAYLMTGRPKEAMEYYETPMPFPDDAQMRWDRARAEYYVGHMADAISDLTEAVRLAPKNPYGVLWLHLSRKRAGQDDREELEANASKLDQSNWPWPVVSFYMGRETLESVRDKSDIGDNERQRKGQVCETNFYVGVDKINNNLEPEGRQLLGSAARECPGDYFERVAAQLELSRLAQSKDRPAHANR